MPCINFERARNRANIVTQKSTEGLVVPGKLWSDADLTALLKIHPRTPAQWRYLGKFKKELPYIKIGKTVRYTDEVVAKFLQSHMSMIVAKD
jgi:hypothetical protein